MRAWYQVINQIQINFSAPLSLLQWPDIQLIYSTYWQYKWSFSGEKNGLLRHVSLRLSSRRPARKVTASDTGNFCTNCVAVSAVPWYHWCSCTASLLPAAGNNCRNRRWPWHVASLKMAHSAVALASSACWACKWTIRNCQIQYFWEIVCVCYSQIQHLWKEQRTVHEKGSYRTLFLDI